jgi:hypothetical protein
MVRPWSASKRVLDAETDPLNNLKKRFYKNSNKPLGNNKLRERDYYNKRSKSTITELVDVIKEKSDNLKKKYS